jgi:hypothetical protein
MISRQLKITLYILSAILGVFLIIIILTLTPVLPNWFGVLGDKSNDSKSNDSKSNVIDY